MLLGLLLLLLLLLVVFLPCRKKSSNTASLMPLVCEEGGRRCRFRHKGLASHYQRSEVERKDACTPEETERDGVIPSDSRAVAP